jgi:hypothetical protein
MKIYLAGNFAMALDKGREEKMLKKFGVWRRLFSFFFEDVIRDSKIIELSSDTKNRRIK